jgi:ribosomal protein S18 acetylase RimI-like enzyme
MPASVKTIDLAPLQSAQVDELVRMWRASFEHGVGVSDPHSLAQQRHYLLMELLPNNAVRVALANGQLLGFVAATRESISQLYVRVGHFGRGIGTTMLEWAKEQSCGSLWLYTYARNVAACRFYEAHGFRAVAHGYEPVWQLEDVKYEWSRKSVPTM